MTTNLISLIQNCLRLKIFSFSSDLSGPAVIGRIITDTIQNDLEVTRRVLQQTQELIDTLEFTVSRLKHYQLMLEEKNLTVITVQVDDCQNALSHQV